MAEEKTRAEDESAGAADPTETAGETTAAGTVSGPADTRPVGTGTLVEVADEPAPREPAHDEAAKESGVTNSER